MTVTYSVAQDAAPPFLVQILFFSCEGSTVYGAHTLTNAFDF